VASVNDNLNPILGETTPSICNVSGGIRQRAAGVCAENNTGFFNYDVEPIPHADKPDS
jgi:hypothetical protein